MSHFQRLALLVVGAISYFCPIYLAIALSEGRPITNPSMSTILNYYCRGGSTFSLQDYGNECEAVKSEILGTALQQVCVCVCLRVPYLKWYLFEVMISRQNLLLYFFFIFHFFSGGRATEKGR